MSLRLLSRVGLVLCCAVAARATEPTLTGEVYLENERLPVPGVQVTLFDLDDLRRHLTVTTDAEGRFSIHLGTGRSDEPPFRVGANYPNPFNPSTAIPFQLARGSHVALDIYNSLGQHVRTLVAGERPAGAHVAVWDARDEMGRGVAAGLYIYRISAAGVSQTGRMVLLDGNSTAFSAAPAALSAGAVEWLEPTSETAGVYSGTYGLTVAGSGIETLVLSELVLPDADATPAAISLGVLRPSPLPAGKAAAFSALLGDVNGDGRVNVTDALIVATYGVNSDIIMPAGGDISLGDANGDGRIDISDALMIATFGVDPENPNLPSGLGVSVVPPAPVFTLSGVVRNRAGETIQGAFVRLGDLLAVTDADGAYQLSGLDLTGTDSLIVHQTGFGDHRAELSFSGEGLAHTVELIPAALPQAAAAADLVLINAGDAVTLRGGSSADPSGRGLVYHWTSVPTNPHGVDFPLNDSGEAFAMSVVLSAPGDFHFRLVVDNGLAMSAPDTVVVTVNGLPTADIDSPVDDAAITSGDLLALSGRGDDHEQGTLQAESLEWHSSLDGPLGSGAVVETDALTIGIHLISLATTDVWGAADTAFVTLTVNPAPPELMPVSGADQIVAVEVGSAPLVVGLVDEFGQVVPDQIVTFEVVSGQAALSSDSEITGELGRSAITVTPLALADVVVQASSPGAVGPVQFSISVALAFDDVAVESVVREALAKPTGEILVNDVSALTDLDASLSSIQTLEGIDQLMALEYLRADLNQISDLMPLSGMTTLQQLLIGSNVISDLSPLADLPGLYCLAAQNNQIDDVSDLDGVTTLESLILWGNEITDISPVANLISLGELDLSENQIANISALSGLTSLTDLNLGENQVTSVTAISGLVNLRDLDLSENQIANISALSGLTSLTDLNLGENQVTSVTAISGLVNLRDLDLSENQITDVTPLAGLTGLTDLSLNENEVNDISSLGGLVAVTGLDLSENHITQVDALANLAALESLNLKRNDIADIQALVDNPGLGDGDDLDVRDNPLSAQALSIQIPALEARGVSVKR